MSQKRGELATTCKNLLWHIAWGWSHGWWWCDPWWHRFIFFFPLYLCRSYNGCTQVQIDSLYFTSFPQRSLSSTRSPPPSTSHLHESSLQKGMATKRKWGLGFSESLMAIHFMDSGDRHTSKEEVGLATHMS